MLGLTIANQKTVPQDADYSLERQSLPEDAGFARVLSGLTLENSKSGADDSVEGDIPTSLLKLDANGVLSPAAQLSNEQGTAWSEGISMAAMPVLDGSGVPADMMVALEQDATLSPDAKTPLSSQLSNVVNVTKDIEGDLTNPGLADGSLISGEIESAWLAPGTPLNADGTVPGDANIAARAFGESVLAQSAEGSETVVADEIDKELTEEQVLANVAMAEQTVEEAMGAVFTGKVAEMRGSAPDLTTELRQQTRTAMQSVESGNSQSSSQSNTQSGTDGKGGQSGFQNPHQTQQAMNIANAANASGQTQAAINASAQALKENATDNKINAAMLNSALGSQSDADERVGSSLISAERRAQLPVGLQSIGLPVSHAKWGQALGQRVVYMANQQIQQAQINLNPEKLGPVQIKLQVDRDQQVQVVMSAHHGLTREAMESAIPRLREMFEAAGVQLASVDVDDQRQFAGREDKDGDDSNQAKTAGSNHDDDETRSEAQVTQVQASDNVVDFYA